MYADFLTFTSKMEFSVRIVCGSLMVKSLLTTEQYLIVRDVARLLNSSLSNATYLMPINSNR